METALATTIAAIPDNPKCKADEARNHGPTAVQGCHCTRKAGTEPDRTATKAGLRTKAGQYLGGGRRGSAGSKQKVRKPRERIK